MSHRSKTERGGAIHLTLAIAIIGAIGLTGLYGESLNDLIDKKAPAIILLLSDGEETWEAQGEALPRATEFLKEAKLPLYAVALGQPAPQPVPMPPAAEGEPAEPATSTAQPEFLKQLAEATGGRLFAPSEDVADFLQRLAQGKEPLPVARSLQPAHPEWGAWLALAGVRPVQ